jgi:hypothetical protein
LNQPGSAGPNASREMRAARGRFLPSSESPTPSTPLPNAQIAQRQMPQPGAGRCARSHVPGPGRARQDHRGGGGRACSSARRNCALAGAILGSSSGLIVIRQLRPDGGQSWPPRAASRAKRLAPPCGGELPVWSGPCRVPRRGRRRILAAPGRAAAGGGSRGRGRAGGRCRAAGRSAPASCHRDSASAGSAAHEGAARPSAWRRPCLPSMPIAGARQGPQDAQ